MRTGSLALALAVLIAPGAQPGRAQVAQALPEGAQMVTESATGFGRLDLPIAPAENGQVQTERLEGALTRVVYQVTDPPELDMLMAQIRATLVERGFEIILDCAARGCGGYDFRRALDTVPPPEMVVDLGRYAYIAARLPEGGTALSLVGSVAAGVGYVQLTRLDPAQTAQGVDAPLPEDAAGTVPPLSSGQGLFNAQGRLVLEGVRFETGSTTLNQQEYPALTQLAAFLKERPGTRVVLVGHTDDEGSLSANMSVSRARAEAVRGVLLRDMGVKPAQVSAEGIGYLAPRASNATEDGRLRNRRVEAVLLTN